MDVKNKTIVITGASTGIGREIALRVAAKEARLVLLARNEQNLWQTEEEVKRITTKVLAIPFDVQQTDQTPELMENIISRFGTIDILINNAGVGHFGTIEKMKLTDFEQVVKTNVFGLVAMTQAALPYLKKSKGMVVMISSTLGKRALPFLSAYAGTKSMVNALSEGLRLELKEYGIRVLNYCPPSVDTGFGDNAIRYEGMDLRSSSHKRKQTSVTAIGKDIVRAIVKEKREVVKGRLFMIANFFFPRLLDYVFYKFMVLKIKH